MYSLYCTSILPYINYGVLTCCNICKIYLDKIFKLQKWAIRTISNSHYRSHTGPLFSKFNVLNVHDTFKLNLGIFIYKHHSNQLSPIFSTYFTKHVQRHIYPTRNAHDYSINETKKMFSDCAIRNCGPSFWNSLDKTVKHCKTTKHFRNQLKSVLLSEYNWFYFGACLVCSCVFFICLYICNVFFESHCKFVETFVKGMIVSDFYGLLIMFSISCFVFMLLFWCMILE